MAERVDSGHVNLRTVSFRETEQLSHDIDNRVFSPLSRDKIITAAAETKSYARESPKRLMRTCLASLDDSQTFGKMVAAEAHRKGIFQAGRQAFVADGMKCNRTMWKTHFATFVPIVDFIHVINYLHKAAVAIGESEDFGWGLCSDWVRACWQGRVDDQHSDGVADQGSQLRVKGTEKFWNDPDGADHILAVKAAALSDDCLYTDCISMSCTRRCGSRCALFAAAHHKSSR